MSAAVLLALLLGLPQTVPGAVPPPPVRTRAECVSPVYAIDHLICSDAALSRDEDELALLQAQDEPLSEAGPWIEDPRAWIARRARCAFQEDQRACITAANAERRRVLTAAPGSATARSALCPDAAGSGRLSLTISGDVIVAFDPDGRRVFVATTASQEWTPFVRIVSPRRLEFRRQDGTVLRCRAV